VSSLDPNDKFQERGLIKIIGKDGTLDTTNVVEVTSDGEIRTIASSSSGVVTDNNPKIFEDKSFVTGDSPATLDANTALGRNATQFIVMNDGAGEFTVATSNDGASYGGEHTMKSGETYAITELSTDSIRITWISNSSYRVVVL